MTPMSWAMFVVSGLLLVVAFYVRFRETRIEPRRWLIEMGVSQMALGYLWLWITVEGGSAKYPNPLWRVLTSIFITASGALAIATYIAARSRAHRIHLPSPAARHACTTDTTCAWLHVRGATERCWPS